MENAWAPAGSASSAAAARIRETKRRIEVTEGVIGERVGER
jgi:hypothetical protein